MSKSDLRVESELGGLTDLATDELRQRWTELYGIVPAPRISRDVLVRGVAFRIQEEAHGGLDKPCRRQLQRISEALRASGSIPASQSPSYKQGTKLIREWKGKVHEVVMTGDGYVWAGKRYRSLSQIARSITGTRWSGPRFFGIEAEKRARAMPATTKEPKRAEAVIPARAGVDHG